MKKEICILVVLVFGICFASAFATKINLIADPNTDFMIRILIPDSNDSIESFELSTNEKGEAIHFFYSEMTNAWFKVMRIESKIVAETKYFSDSYKYFVIGDSIYIDYNNDESYSSRTGEKIKVSEDNLLQNESENQTEELVSEGINSSLSNNGSTQANNVEESVGQKLSGAVITSYKDIVPKIKGYLFIFIAAIVALFCIVFLLRRQNYRGGGGSSRGTNSGFAGPKKPDYGENVVVIPKKDIEKELEDAESKIKILQEEMNELKNKNSQITYKYGTNKFVAN